MLLTIQRFLPLRFVLILQLIVNVSAVGDLKSLGGNLNACSSSLLKQSSEVPTDIHKVRPADIRIIGALGDSFTVGYNSKNSAGDAALDYFGNSWSTGGDESLETHITIANILSVLNPGLIGKSYGTQKSGFNSAFSGRTCEDLPRQADEIVANMKNNEKVNIENDWKFITLFIGTNDVGTLNCRNDFDPIPYETYKAKIEEALLKLKKNLPRTIVHVLAMWNAEFSIEAKNLIYTGNRLSCTNDKNSEIRQRDALISSYRQAVYEIQKDPQFHTSDFNVFVQGFLDDVTEPVRDSKHPNVLKYDTTFYDEDLFYLSKYGNDVMAKWFWNGMIHNGDTGAADEDTPLLCPDENSPYVRTAKSGQGIISCLTAFATIIMIFC